METTPSIYLGINDEQVGPFTTEEVQAKLAAGEITEETLAWKEGMAEWAPLRTLSIGNPVLKLRPVESTPSPTPQSAPVQPAAAQPKPALSLPSRQTQSATGGARVTRTCSACNESIQDAYHLVDGKVMCERCRNEAEAALQGGSAMMGFLRAAGLGLLASVVSAAVWYGVTKATGYQFGLIAIAVGLLVGFAVRFGSYNRGGWAYQLLAVFLTYLAIAGSNVPFIVEGMRDIDGEGTHQKHARSSRQTLAQTTTNDLENSALTIAPDANPAAPSPSKVSGTRAGNAAAQEEDNQPMPLLFAWVFACGLAFISPFLGGIMGIVILGIALYEAWKINTRIKREITGPHPVGVPIKA